MFVLTMRTCSYAACSIMNIIASVSFHTLSFIVSRLICLPSRSNIMVLFDDRGHIIQEYVPSSYVHGKSTRFETDHKATLSAAVVDTHSKSSSLAQLIDSFLSQSNVLCPSSFTLWLTPPNDILTNNKYIRNAGEVHLLNQISIAASSFDTEIDIFAASIRYGEQLEQQQTTAAKHICLNTAFPQTVTTTANSTSTMQLPVISVPIPASPSSSLSSVSLSFSSPSSPSISLASLSLSSYLSCIGPFIDCSNPAIHEPEFFSHLSQLLIDHVASVGQQFSQIEVTDDMPWTTMISICVLS